MSDVLRAEGLSRRRSFACARYAAAAAAVATLSACGTPLNQSTSVASAKALSRDPHVVDVARGGADDAVFPPTTTAGASVELSVRQGRLLGVGTGTSLGEALRTLGVKPVAEPVDGTSGVADRASDLSACSSSGGMRWSVHSGGLAMAFEGSSAESARLTTWRYAGGPALGFTVIVAPGNIRIGDSREELIAAYKNAYDLGDVVDVDSAHLRFGVDGDTITWFGSLDCNTDG
jgi:hypothetical protein